MKMYRQASLFLIGFAITSLTIITFNLITMPGNLFAAVVASGTQVLFAGMGFLFVYSAVKSGNDGNHIRMAVSVTLIVILVLAAILLYALKI